MKVAEAAKTTADNVVTTLQRAEPVWEKVLPLTYSALLAVNLEPREFVFDIAEAKVGDRIQIFRAARPTFNGIALIGKLILEPHVTVFDAGKVPVIFTTAVLGLGLSLSAPLRMIAYRPVAT